MCAYSHINSTYAAYKQLINAFFLMKVINEIQTRSIFFHVSSDGCILFRFEYKPQKIKTENGKKAKKRKQEYEDEEEEEVS